MKKITLVIFMSLLSFLGYAQLPESFDTGIPATWSVSDNGFGTPQNWTTTSTLFLPTHGGSQHAIANRGAIGAGNTSENWLVTPLLTVPTNGQFRFWTKMSISGESGTLYQLRVSTTSQTNQASFTTIQQWTETELETAMAAGGSTGFNVYGEIVKNLTPTYTAGQNIYIAFVKVNEQSGASIEGDRWLIDDVNLVQQCVDPLTLNATAITATTAQLSWTSPGPATSWDIEMVASPGTPTGIPTVIGVTNPYTYTGLTAGTQYSYYVRSVCGAGNSSNWVGPFIFLTSPLGQVCSAPISITALPYSHSSDTALYGDTVDGSPGTSCGFLGNFLNGNDVFYSFTPSFTGSVDIALTPTGSNSGVFVYANCGAIGTTCLAGIANSGSGIRNIPNFAVTAGTPYIIVISTNGTPQTLPYSLTIQQVNCAQPNALTATGITASGVTLGWTSAFSAFEYVIQPVGTGLPLGAGTPSANPVTVNTLSSNTIYEYYVRANCGGGLFSIWAGPFNFRTSCSTIGIPFFEGFNGTPASSTEFCWTALNENGDANAWNMNYANNPYEGDQSASIVTSGAPSNDDWLISPQLTLNGNQRLKYRYRVGSSACNFEIKVSTTGPVPANFTTTILPQATYNNNTYLEKVVNMPGIVGNVNIGWHVAPGANGTRIYIDAVTVEDIPLCAEPSGIDVSAITYNSASINWTLGGTETAWQVLVQPAGSPAPTLPTQGTSVLAAPPYVATGLNGSTAYDVYVLANCGSNGSSIWVGPVSFTTLIAPPFCGGNFYDAAGPSANYAASSNSTVTICPTTPGDVVTVTFTDFQTEENYDFLKVYDGNSASAPLLANLTGSALPPAFTSTASNGCLTFVFTSDGSFQLPGWSANVTCSAGPTCPRPSALTASQVTTTSAMLGWTESGTSTQWQMLILPAGSPIPVPGTPGTIVNANPALITGLTPGMGYTYFVSAICSPTDASYWSTGFNFTTPPANDECTTAIFVPVNGSAVCNQSVSGTLFLATGSAGPAIAPCIGTPNDDVWFKFIASNTDLNVSLQNVQGSTMDLNFAVYSGSCAGLSQIFCSAADSLSGSLTALTVGQTYYIRVYSNSASQQDTTFNLCISTPPNCGTAPTVCNLIDNGNTTGVADMGEIGCLDTTPNPAYFTIQVGTSGPLNFLLTQTSIGSTIPDLDVDYAAWGPFTSQAAGCAAISGGQAPLTGVTTGCSYSFNPTENFNIANAQAGEYYIILITNYSDDPGFINLTQTNAGTPGAATTICCPNADFSYVPGTYCKGSSTNPIATIAAGSLAGTFSSSNPAVVFVNTSTGEINLSATPAGNYIIYNTVSPSVNCNQPKTYSYVISIVDAVSATISYSAAAYCNSLAGTQPVTVSGTPGGTFSVTPAGLLINPTTGAITPVGSTPGNYTVSYNFPVSIGCSTTAITTNVSIAALPSAPTVSETTVPNCSVPTGTITISAPLGAAYEYSINGVAYQASPVFAGLTSGVTYTVTVRVAGGGCVSVGSTITISAIQGAPVAPTASVTVQPTCAVPTGTIDVSAPTGATLEYSVDGVTYQLGTSFVGLTSGSYNVTVRDTATGCVSPITVVVVNPLPAAPSVPSVTVTVEPTCTIPTASVEITSPVGANYEYNVDATVFQTSPVLTGLAVGSHTITVRDIATGCTSQTTLSVTAPVVPSTPGLVVDNQPVCNDAAGTIEVLSPLGAMYEYALNSGMYQTNPLFVGLNQGVYLISVRDIASGCVSQTASIEVKDLGCSIPRGISPNDDGKNENFDLSSLNVTKLSVYNRYGRITYSYGVGYTNQWHGQSDSGQELPDGTYYYVIDIANGSTKTGWVYINREIK